MRYSLLIVPYIGAFAFNPQATGWYGESSCSATISSAEYQGCGMAGTHPTTTGYIRAENYGRGEFSLLGAELRQMVGWKEWLSLELSGGYSSSLGGAASSLGDDIGYGILDALPARLSLWDADVVAFTSLALDKTRSVFIEPAVGFALVVANMRAATKAMPLKNWESLSFYGPTFGLYMRLFLTPRASLRFGGGYMASRLRMKSYTSVDSYYLSPGELKSRGNLHARRHSLLARIRLDYRWNSSIAFHTTIEGQSWSAGGGAPGRNYLDQKATTPMLSRTRLVWGADFTY